MNFDNHEDGINHVDNESQIDHEPITEKPINYKFLMDALGLMAWGFLFQALDLNLMGFDVLPDFVGWILLLLGMGKLASFMELNSFFRPIAVVMLVFSAISSILALWGIELPLFFAIPIAIFSIVFNYILLGLLEKIADMIDDREHKNTLHICTLLYIVPRCILLVSGYLVGLEALQIIISIGLIVVVIMILSAVFGMRNKLREAYRDLVEESKV